MTETVLVALIGFLGSAAVGSLVTWALQRRKEKVDITDQITETALSLLQPLKDRVSELEGTISRLNHRIVDLEAMNSDLEDWAERLTCQVKEAHLEPAKFIRHSEQVTQHQHKRNTE